MAPSEQRIEANREAKESFCCLMLHGIINGLLVGNRDFGEVSQEGVWMGLVFKGILHSLTLGQYRSDQSLPAINNTVHTN